MKAAGVSMGNICHWTSVSERSVQRIVSVFQKTGSWGAKKQRKLRVGKLDAAAVEVCSFFISTVYVVPDLLIGPGRACRDVSGPTIGGLPAIFGNREGPQG
jgi:hypothetical protein